MKRRILPMIMAIMMILSIIQVPAWAATGDDPAGEDGNPGQVSEQPVEESAEPSAPEEEPAPEEQAENYVAEVNSQGFTTLQAAIDAANGAEITLLANVKDCARITLSQGETVNINLNGYNIGFVQNGYFYIQHGTLNLTGNGEVYEQSPYYGAVLMKGGAEDVSNYSVVTVGENVTLRGWAGLFIDKNGNNNYGIVANVYGTLESVKDTSGAGGHALYVNGTIKATEGNVPKITLDGATLNTVAGNGMYLAGYAETSIRNSTITSSSEGSTGIEIRAGKLTITDSTVTGGSGEYEGGPNGNGSTSSNVALAVVQHTTKLPLEVTVNGGTFSGGAAFIQADEQNNGDEAIAKIKIDIQAGKFEGQVYSENVENFISGGTFSDTENITSENYLTDSVKLENNEVTPLGPTDEASVAQVGSTYYKSLSAAIAAAKDGGTVTLLKDNETTDTIVVRENLTLDLHGCTLTLSQPQSKEPQFVVSSTGDLTIRDTLGNGKMDITGSLGVKSGKLTLESGTIGSDYYGIYVYDNGTAVINGGTINSKYAGLSGNNTTGDMNFEVNGGKLNTTDGPAIYMPGQMTLKITGGTLNGGISLRMGQVTISGGTINATAGFIDDPKDYYNKSENAWLPDALYVFNGTYGSGNETYGNALNLTITGGTFNCANGQGSAIAIYDIGKVSQESAVTISGNAELSTNAENREAYQVLSLKDIGVENPDTGYGNTEFVGKADTSISGGTFSSAVEDEYCAPGFEPTTTADGKHTVAVANDMTVKIVDANGNDVAAYETLDAALTHVTPGQTIALLANVEYNGKVSIPEGVTLDGNGNAITATAEITSGAFIEVMTDNVTIKDLVVNTNGKAKHGIQFYQTKGGELSGVTVNGGSYTSVIVNGSTDIRIENCTLNPGSGAYANIEYAMGSGVTTVPSVTVSNPKYDSGKPLVYVDSATIKAITNEANPSDKDIADALEQVNKNVTISGMEMVWVNGSFVARPIPTPVDPGDDDDDNNNSGSSSVRRYDIEADAGRGGDISPDGRVRVRRGENQTFRITADDGYEIYDVEVDGESVGAVSRYTFENVREDHTISATFRQTGAQTEEAQLPFLDVAEGAWYYDAVTYCYENGIMDGTSSVSFAPGMLLNRAMAAQVLYNLADGTASTAAGFPDVAASAWYADAVNWAAANGYVTGYDNGSFGPEDSLTREQLAVILYRYAGSPEPTGSLDGFTDAASASDYAVDALRWAVGEGLLTGKDGGRLDPAGTASRAELAQILARFAQM